ncbi:hypothetical protein [Bacillus cereus]|uniref:Uncharacterized protein n=1 Tax=Bacillus cereus VD184 TaxID=1053242 RepID=A0A9W5RB49_BACCE|nr:hypothetical protein [Bacillus cereus]EOQ18632.1 hypothetical protein IKC_05133 [Bacillus cereus VD184]
MGTTRDIVAEKIGIGSGKQYEKAKFIAENADSETIKQLDSEEISIHKAYTDLKVEYKEKDKLIEQLQKSEQLTRKRLEEQGEQEPQVIEREVVKEVVVESKEHINIINKLKDENIELKDIADFYKKKADALLKNPRS